MLHSRRHYRAGMIVVLWQQRPTRKRVGATGTTLAVARIVLGARAAALAVFMLCGIVTVLLGMLTSGSIRNR